MYPPPGRGSAARVERNRKGARPLESLRGQRAGEHGVPGVGGARQRAHRRPTPDSAGGVLKIVTDQTLAAPIFQQGFIWGVGSRVEVPGAGLIQVYPYAAPCEDLKLK